MSNPAPKLISDLSPGDRVIFTSGIPGTTSEVGQVEKVTATQVVVCGKRFPRQQESSATAIESGGSFVRARIRISDPGEFAKLTQENRARLQVAKLQRTDWQPTW